MLIITIKTGWMLHLPVSKRFVFSSAQDGTTTPINIEKPITIILRDEFKSTYWRVDSPTANSKPDKKKNQNSSITDLYTIKLLQLNLLVMIPVCIILLINSIRSTPNNWVCISDKRVYNLYTGEFDLPFLYKGKKNVTAITFI